MLCLFIAAASQQMQRMPAALTPVECRACAMIRSDSVRLMSLFEANWYIDWFIVPICVTEYLPSEFFVRKCMKFVVPAASDRAISSSCAMMPTGSLESCQPLSACACAP